MWASGKGYIYDLNELNLIDSLFQLITTIFLIGFFSKNIPKMIGVKKVTLLIWTCWHNKVVNLDPIVLIDKVIDYLIGKQWTI
jgi:hypothetical protein